MKQKQLPEANRSLAVVVRLVFEELPIESRDTRSICEAVKRRATAAEWLTWGEQNLVQGVRAALRTRDRSGLPVAVSLDHNWREGEQLEFPDFVTWAYDMARRGREMHDRTREIAALCLERTGRSFDPEEIIAAAHAGEAVSDVLARLVA